MKTLKKISILVFIISLASCTVKKAEETTTESAYSKMTNHKWILTENNEALKNYSGQDITLIFDLSGNTISGFSGCNQYFTNNYKIDENGNLSFGTISATKKYCPDNNIEKTYLDMLNNVTRYEMVNDQLNLYKDNLLLLTYTMLLE